MNTVNPESERAASFKEAKILETVADLNVVLGLSGEITPLAGIELARACALMLMMAVKQDGAEEFFHNIVEECDAPHDTLALVVGHFVMQALGEARLDLTTLAAKQFLMAAGHIIGPDHLDALRKNVAFMIRVEGFQ